MDTQRLSQTVQPLLDWFRTHARTLPWRADREPYHVWLSEIMLQQTRVEAVRGYYARFLAAAPDVFALAALPEAQLLTRSIFLPLLVTWMKNIEPGFAHVMPGIVNR